MRPALDSINQSYDTRDAQEHTDVEIILGVLLEGHPARVAYADRTGTLELTHLVVDRPELAEELKEAWLAGYRRLLARSSGFRPY